MPNLLGCKPRMYDPRVPHMSALLAGKKLPPIPASQHYATGMPADLGMMLNDTLCCCTCAAYYHARQVWTFNSARIEDTLPDSDVLALYEAACGYRPDDPTTDEGGVEQGVLKYLLQTGAPLVDSQVDKILAFVEVDPRNIDDVKRTIFDCGVAYIGFNVPASIMPAEGDTPAVWTFDPNNSANQGGHAVVLCGYDAEGADVISWGKVYKMTWGFFSRFTSEVYAIADRAWGSCYWTVSCWTVGEGPRVPDGIFPRTCLTSRKNLVFEEVSPSGLTSLFLRGVTNVLFNTSKVLEMRAGCESANPHPVSQRRRPRTAARLVA